MSKSVFAMPKYQEKNCPICHKNYTGYSAISRFDNKQEICSRCGNREAYIVYINSISGESIPYLKLMLNFREGIYEPIFELEGI